MHNLNNVTGHKHVCHHKNGCQHGERGNPVGAGRDVLGQVEQKQSEADNNYGEESVVDEKQDYLVPADHLCYPICPHWGESQTNIKKKC